MVTVDTYQLGHRIEMGRCKGGEDALVDASAGGRLTVEAIQNNDFRTVSAMVYISSLLFIIANLMTDISYTFVDPRVRLK